MATRLADNPLVCRLRALGLDPDDFVVFGSAPLLVHGMRDTVPDLDVVVRDSAWHRVEGTGIPSVGAVTGDPVWTFWGGRIQFTRRWISAEWDTDALIARAEVVEGIRFAPLWDVLAYKKILNRPKDVADIRKLARRLTGRDPARSCPDRPGDGVGDGGAVARTSRATA